MRAKRPASTYTPLSIRDLLRVDCRSTPLPRATKVASTSWLLNRTNTMSNEQRAKLALIGIRYDENSSFTKGAADAPPQIRAALRSDAWTLTSENGTDLSGDSIFFDAGNIEPVTGSEMSALIENSVHTLIADDLMPISLGGDHSITAPVVRAFARKYKDLNILHFDAHPDIYDSYQGNRNSHASPFARIMEEKLVKRLVQVGIRTFTVDEREQVRRFGVESIEMRNLQPGLQL